MSSLCSISQAGEWCATISQLIHLFFFFRLRTGADPPRDANGVIVMVKLDVGDPAVSTDGHKSRRGIETMTNLATISTQVRGISISKNSDTVASSGCLFGPGVRNGTSD